MTFIYFMALLLLDMVSLLLKPNLLLREWLDASLLCTLCFLCDCKWSISFFFAMLSALITSIKFFCIYSFSMSLEMCSSYNLTSSSNWVHRFLSLFMSSCNAIICSFIYTISLSWFVLISCWSLSSSLIFLVLSRR